MYQYRFDDKFSGALFIDSEIPENMILSYIIENEINSIIINWCNGFSGDTIKPFCSLPSITSLEVVLNDCDISCIQGMTQLEKLSISCEGPIQIDLSVFSNLKELSFDWSKEIIGLESCDNLTSLRINKYKGSQVQLGELKNIESLYLSAGSLKSLDFLSSYTKLRKIDISYLYKLENVSGLVSIVDSLEELEIVACKNINWNGELYKMKNLKKLIVSGSEFPNIKFAEILPKLNHFSFWDSNVLDGDISYAKNIKFVSFNNKKHYNYRYDSKDMKIIPK